MNFTLNVGFETFISLLNLQEYTGTTHPFDYPYSWNECDSEQFIRNIPPE